MNQSNIPGREATRLSEGTIRAGEDVIRAGQDF